MTTTIELGGQDRSLLFGTMGYFRYIKEATGQEPFEWLEAFDKLRGESISGNVSLLIDDLCVFIYAGINSSLDSKDAENVSFEQVKKWCNGITIDQATEVLRVAFGTIQSDAPGEPSPLKVVG